MNKKLKNMILSGGISLVCITNVYAGMTEYELPKVLPKKVTLQGVINEDGSLSVKKVIIPSPPMQSEVSTQGEVEGTNKSLIKAGTGALTLSEGRTYSGMTTIYGKTFSIGGISNTDKNLPSRINMDSSDSTDDTVYDSVLTENPNPECFDYFSSFIFHPLSRYLKNLFGTEAVKLKNE